MARVIAVVIAVGLLVSVHTSNKPTRHVEITAEQEKLRDPEGFQAIVELHHLMDDDQSGSIDRSESADFLKEDMKIGGGLDRARREKAFHHNNDESITVDDLWESWFASEERAWTADEVVEWLRNVVRLPQYADNFASAKVTGMALPRMATQNSSFILNVLGIKNFVHRQKLQLKALDLVLFGFQDVSSRFKDFALAALLVLLASVLILFKTHRTRSKQQMAELSSMLSELKNMENDFEGAEQKLDEDRQRHMSQVESVHIEELKNQLIEANRRIEMNGYDSIPFELQPLLRRTYQSERSHIDKQKMECLAEMREAKEFVDRMRRKQSGLMASFKIATGTTGGTEDIDSRIFALKARMEKSKLAMDECQQRWIEIESLCGFSITGPFGPSMNLNGGIAHEESFNGIPHSAMEYDTIHSTNSTIMSSNGVAGPFETMTNGGTDNVVDASDTTSGYKSAPRANPRHFQHSISQQQLRLQQLQQHQLQISPSDSISGCVQVTYDTESLTAPVTHNHNGPDGHLKILKPTHRQSIAAGVVPTPIGAPFSEDSSSLSSSNSKGFGLKKPKKLSNFLRRKLSKA